MNKPTIYRYNSCEHPTIFQDGFICVKKGNKMVGYNYREHWGAEKTPLAIAVLDFFANHPAYKITVDEFAFLVSVMTKRISKDA